MADFLSNIILFMPLGFGLALRDASLRRAVLTSSMLSLAVETMQLFVISGRDPSFGDIAANSLGGLVGWMVWRMLPWWCRGGRGAWIRSLTLATAALAILLGGLWFLVPAPPSTIYFVQWTADLGHLENYKGRVQEATLGPLELQEAMQVGSSDSIKHLLEQPEWKVLFTAGPEPTSVAPILSIYDELQQEVALLGARGSDVVYRQRMRAADFGLDQLDFRAWSMLESIESGDDVLLRISVDRSRTCVGINHLQECGRGYSVGDTWGLLMFPESWGRTMRAAMNLIWLFGLFMPAGFIINRPAGLAGIAFVAMTGSLLGPLSMGFSPPSPWEVLAIVAGLSTAHIASQVVWSRSHKVSAELPGEPERNSGRA